MGFHTSFEVPHLAKDVWSELFTSRYNPLGTATGTYAVVDQTCRRYLAGESSGKPARAIRTVHLPDGSRITYSMVECHAGRYAAFEILEQSSADPLELQGVDGALPRVAFQFEAVQHGTAVKIRFDIARATAKGESGRWFGPPPADHTEAYRQQFTALGVGWDDDMRRRGYLPQGRPVVPWLNLDLAASLRPPEVEVETPCGSDVPSEVTASSRALPSAASEATANTASAGQHTESAARRLVTRSKPFWKIEQEKGKRRALQRAEQHHAAGLSASGLAAASAVEPAVRAPSTAAAGAPGPTGKVWAPGVDSRSRLRVFKIEGREIFGAEVQEQPQSDRAGLQLVIVGVRPGSMAELLGVPINGVVTRLNGAPLSSVVPMQHLQRVLDANERPVWVSVSIPPPKPTQRCKTKQRFSLRRLFGFSRSAAAHESAKGGVKATSATPDATSRSCESSQGSNDVRENVVSLEHGLELCC